jgi:DNA excision repair protein ERCC-6
VCVFMAPQIYKSYLTNKVLQDPRQRRFFASRDISDLFTLADEHGGTKKRSVQEQGNRAEAGPALGAAVTETGRIFSDVVREQRVAAATAAGSAGKAGAGRTASSRRARAAPVGTPADPPAAGSVSPAGSLEQGPLHCGGLLTENDEQGAVVSGSDDRAGGDDDARVLRDLFDGSGIRSLMDHSSIESANDPDAVKADEHAVRVAARAAELLRRSRQACQTAAVSVPTWTGRHGVAGAPGASRTPQQPPPQQQQQQARRVGSSGNLNRTNPSAAEIVVCASSTKFGQVRNPLLLNVAPLSLAAAPGVDDAAAAAVSRGAGITSAAIGAEGYGAPPAAASGIEPLLPSVPSLSSCAGAFAGRQAGTTGGAAPSSAALLSQIRQRRAAEAAAAAAGDRGVLPVGPQTSRQQQRGLSFHLGRQPRHQHEQQQTVQHVRKVRQRTIAADGGISAAGVSSSLSSQIVDFIEAAGGCANSELLISHFQEVLTAADMPRFKQVLRQVAILQPCPAASRSTAGRQNSGGKVWVLRAGL